jgi:hypothetical protein
MAAAMRQVERPEEAVLRKAGIPSEEGVMATAKASYEMVEEKAPAVKPNGQGVKELSFRHDGARRDSVVSVRISGE